MLLISRILTAILTYFFCVPVQYRCCSALVLDDSPGRGGEAGSGWSPTNSTVPTFLRRCVAAYADGLDAVQAGLGDAMRAHGLQPSKTSARRIVLGAGSGKTATRSLYSALVKLGLKGWHYRQSNTRRPANIWEEPLIKLLGRQAGPYNATAAARCHAELQAYDFTGIPEDVEFILDTPTAELFIDLFLAFPEARFLLTTRPAMEWAFKRQRFRGIELAPIQEPCGQHVEDFSTKSLAQLEELKNRLVTCVVPPERLLTISVFTDPASRIQGLMQEVGAFVGHPLAEDVAFPGSKRHNARAV